MGNTAIVLISNAQFLEQIQVYLNKGWAIITLFGHHTETVPH